MLKFNNRRIAEFDRRISSRVLNDNASKSRDQYVYSPTPQEPYAVFKPCGLLRNNKLVGISFTENEMRNLLKRKGIVKPYISPYGNGVLPLTEDTATKLSKQYGIYDILLTYNDSEFKEVEIINEVDKEPTFNTGMVVGVDNSLILRWMEGHVKVVNELVNNSTTKTAQQNRKYFVVAELYARYKSTSSRVRRTMENITKIRGGDPTDKNELKAVARGIVNYNKNTLLLLSSLELQLHEFKNTIHENHDIDTLDKIVNNFIKEVLEVNGITH